MKSKDEVLIIVKKDVHKRLWKHKLDTNSKTLSDAIKLLLEGKNEQPTK